MPFLTTIIREGIKGVKPELKRGAKEALELPTEKPAPIKEMPQPKAEEVAPAPKDEAPAIKPVDETAAPVDKAKAQVEAEAADVDAEVRQSLAPEKPVTAKLKPTDPEIVARVDTKAIKLDAEKESAALLSRDLDKFDANDSWQPNFDTFETTDDVVSTIASMAERNKASITEARRGQVTDEQLKLLAAEMHVDGRTLSTVMERKTGEALSAETIVATRQFLSQSASRIRSLAVSVNEGAADDRMKVTLRRQLELHSEVMEQFMGARAETGRTLRAFGIKIGDDMEQLAQMKEVIESAHGKDLETLARGLADVDSIEGLNKLIKEYPKGKLAGVVEEVFINSILSGVKTQIVNITGNALMPIKGMAENAIAARIGKFSSAEDKVLIGEAQAQMFGYISAFNDAMKMAAKAFKHGAASDAMQKYETQYPKAISSQNLDAGGSLMRIADMLNITLPQGLYRGLNKGVDVAGTAIRFPTERLLTPMDEFFKTLARRGDVARNAFREASLRQQAEGLSDDEFVRVMSSYIENPPKAAQSQADDMALYMTFQTPLGERGQQVQSIVNKTPGLKFLAPFIRTPTNLFKMAFGEMTPLGLLSSSFKARQDWAAGGARRHMMMARQAMGMSFAMSAATMTASGRITGGGPSDSKARSTLMATGWRPYSIKVENPMTGDIEYHSYARIEPLAFIIGSVADFTEMTQWSDFEGEEGQRDMDEMAAAIVAGIAQNTMSKTFVRGMSDFTQAMNDPTRYFGSWIEGFGEALVPFSALRRDLTKIQDPTIRAAWEYTDKLKKSSGIAGWADDVPPRRDIYGQVLTHHQGDILGVLSPFPRAKETRDRAKLEIARVMQSTHQVPVTAPSKRISGLKLDVHEYDRLVVLSRSELTDGKGRNFKEALDDLISSDMYDRATEDSKVDLIKKLQHGYDKRARAVLLDENDILNERVYKKKVQNAVDKLGEESVNRMLGGQ